MGPPRSAAETSAIPLVADIAVDIGAACAAAFSVSPFIMTIDKAIVEASAGTTSLGRAMLRGVGSLLLRPHRVLLSPSYWMVAGVYGCTYGAANLIDSVCERTLDPAHEHSSKIHGGAKLVGTTAANMGSGIAKDIMFAKMFGASGASGPVPRATTGLFALRDVCTIGAAFTIPNPLASLFVTTNAVPEKYAREVAQFASPVMMQVVCAPLHLLALDFYNVREISLSQRFTNVSAVLPPTFLVRMIRQLPAFGIGGVMNTSLVHRGRDYNLREFYAKPRAAAEPDDAGPWARYGGELEQPDHRRRIMDSYAAQLDTALDLLGEVDPATVESADGLRLPTLLRSFSSGGLRRHGSASIDPGTGYYPELAELVEQKLLTLQKNINPLVGLLGDGRDVPDVDHDLVAKLQGLNSVEMRSVEVRSRPQS